MMGTYPGYVPKDERL